MFNIGAISQNEIREKEDIENGDQYYVPLNMVNTKIQKMNNRETRNYNSELRVETREDGKASIICSGLRSENLGGFREKIDPGAFDSVLKRRFEGFDQSRFKPEYLEPGIRLKVDERGLVYEIRPPTQVTQMIWKALSRGDMISILVLWKTIPG